MSNIDWSKLITRKMKQDKIEAQLLAERVAVEATWRATELAVIARQLEAIEEAEVADEGEEPVDLLPGTRKQWLNHRSKVSVWKEGTASFPDSMKRPVRPS